MVTVLRGEVRQVREGLGPRARPWERTGSLDVEQLAQWAWGVQMVDRFERVGLHAIEAAAAGYEVSGYSADGVGQLMAIEHLGCRIDRGSAFVADAVHPVALAVAAALAEVDGGERVRFHARSATRPTAWVEPKAKARASVWVVPGEKAQVEYQGPGRKGAYCPVILLWDPQREAWGRADYRQWWDALAELAWRLSTRALGFTVTGPAAPAKPWLGTEKRAEPSAIALDGEPRSDPPRGSSQPPSPPMRCGSA